MTGSPDKDDAIGNVNVEFSIAVDYTINFYDRILRELEAVNVSYELGGDDGNIQFMSDGRVYLYDINSEDMPEILRIIIKEAKSWPSYVAISGGDELYIAPNRFPFCRKDADPSELWQWMVKEASEDQGGEDDESEIHRDATRRYPSMSGG